MVGPNFRVGKKIGCGNFGELRLGKAPNNSITLRQRGGRKGKETLSAVQVALLLLIDSYDKPLVWFFPGRLERT